MSGVLLATSGVMYIQSGKRCGMWPATEEASASAALVPRGGNW